MDHLIFQLTFLLTLTCTSICFTRRDVCMHDIFFSVCKMFLRLQITAINEICKPTGTNVFVNLTKLFYTRKTIFCVLEVTCIFCLEIFTNGALSNVLSGNFRPYTCKYKIKKCICRWFSEKGSTDFTQLTRLDIHSDWRCILETSFVEIAIYLGFFRLALFIMQLKLFLRWCYPVPRYYK